MPININNFIVTELKGKKHIITQKSCVYVYGKSIMERDLISSSILWPLLLSSYLYWYKFRTKIPLRDLTLSSVSHQKIDIYFFTGDSKKKPVVVTLVAILSSLALLACIYLFWRCIKRKIGDLIK
jgi:hypothetical protein